MSNQLYLNQNCTCIQGSTRLTYIVLFSPAGCAGWHPDHRHPHRPHLPRLDPSRSPGLGQPPLPCVCPGGTILLVLQLPRVRLLQPDQSGHHHHYGCRGWGDHRILDQPFFPARVQAHGPSPCYSEHPAPHQGPVRSGSDQIYGGNCAAPPGSSTCTKSLAASAVLLVQGGHQKQGGQAETGDRSALQVCHLHVSWHLCHHLCANATQVSGITVSLKWSEISSLDVRARHQKVVEWGSFDNTFFFKKKIKKALSRASLVAQWLRVCLLMQGTRVRALVWEDPTCRGAAGPVSHGC